MAINPFQISKGSDMHRVSKSFLRKKLATVFCLFSLLASSGMVLGHDHHDGMHHWEIPSKDPDRIILTFHGDPATSRAVTWRTDHTVTKTTAQIAKATKNSGFTDRVSIEAKTEALDLGIHTANNKITVHYHSVIFTNLTPDTVTVVGACAGQGTDATVTVDFAHTLQVVNGFAPSLGPTIDLTGRSTMRNE